jgi:hypothetical protein
MLESSRARACQFPDSSRASGTKALFGSRRVSIFCPLCCNSGPVLLIGG